MLLLVIMPFCRHLRRIVRIRMMIGMLQGRVWSDQSSWLRRSGFSCRFCRTLPLYLPSDLKPDTFQLLKDQLGNHSPMGQEFCCLNKSIYTCSLESFSAIENEACLFEVTCIKCFGFFRVVVVIGWAGVAILRINCAPEVRRLSSMAHGESRSPS